jgi:hypothetical protein
MMITTGGPFTHAQIDSFLQDEQTAINIFEALTLPVAESETREVGVRFDNKTDGTGTPGSSSQKATRPKLRVAFCYLPVCPCLFVPWDG